MLSFLKFVIISTTDGALMYVESVVNKIGLLQCVCGWKMVW